MAKLLGAKIGNFHTLTDWGLYLKVGSPKISAAEVDEYLVQVTGSDALLNLTAWDDGKVHYKKRTITMELLSSTFTITGTCNPFKRSVYDGTNDWLWDDFNFEYDIVRNYTDIPLKANEDVQVSITGAPRAAGIYFKRSEDAADIAVSLNGFEVGILAKSTDWQYIEGLTMPDGVVGTLVFAASADCSISIKYLGASL